MDGERRDARLVELARHEIGVGHADAESEGPGRARVAVFLAELVEDRPDAQVVARVEVRQAVDVVSLAGPADGGQVGPVGDAEVVERREEAPVEGVPEPDLGRGAAPEPAEDVSPVGPLRGGRQAEKDSGPEGVQEGLVAVGRAAVDLVDDDVVPVVGFVAREESPGVERLDACEEVVDGGRLVPTAKPLAEGPVAQDVAEGELRLLEDLVPVRHEEKTGPSAGGLGEATVVECGDDGLAGPRRGDDEVAIPVIRFPFSAQFFEDLLLERVRPEVEEEPRGLASIRGGAEGLPEPLLPGGVVRVEPFELRVRPERLELPAELLDRVRVAPLGELDRPLEAVAEGRGREVGRADVGRAEARLAVEEPRLGVEARAPGVVGDPHLDAGEACERLQRSRVGGAHVDRRQEPEGAVGGGEGLERLAQLLPPAPGDERDDRVDAVGRRDLGDELGPEPGVPPGPGEEARPPEGRGGPGRSGGGGVDGFEKLGGGFEALLEAAVLQRRRQAGEEAAQQVVAERDPLRTGLLAPDLLQDPLDFRADCAGQELWRLVVGDRAFRDFPEAERRDGSPEAARQQVLVDPVSE